MISRVAIQYRPATLWTLFRLGKRMRNGLNWKCSQTGAIRKRCLNCSQFYNSSRVGSCPVHMRVLHPDAEATFAFGAQWYVTPEDQLIYELQQFLSKPKVNLQFH